MIVVGDLHPGFKLDRAPVDDGGDEWNSTERSRPLVWNTPCTSAYRERRTRKAPRCCIYLTACNITRRLAPTCQRRMLSFVSILETSHKTATSDRKGIDAGPPAIRLSVKNSLGPSFSERSYPRRRKTGTWGEILRGILPVCARRRSRATCDLRMSKCALFLLTGVESENYPPS